MVSLAQVSCILMYAYVAPHGCMVDGLGASSALSVMLTYIVNFINRGEWWCVAFGFSIVIFGYDEVRKWLIRRNPKSK